MKKNELMNGDYVVMSSGSVAVIIGEGSNAYFLYQYGGFEVIDETFDDNLNCTIDDDMVMQVFRPNVGYGFEGIDEEWPIWERNEDWECPTEKEREEQHRKLMEQREAELNASLEHAAEARKDLIFVIAQGFYGNRTGTEIHRDKINHFLKGYHTPGLTPNEDQTVNRKIINVPGSDHIVIVYDQIQEDEYLNVKFPEMVAEYGADYLESKEECGMTPWISCRIPELDIELHSRCFACRIDENGEFQSLENEDFDKFIQYFPTR